MPIKFQKRLFLPILLLILVAYIVLQMSWGSRLYGLYKTESYTELETLFNDALRNYSYSFYQQQPSKSGRHETVFEPIAEANDSVLTNAFTVVRVDSAEELTGLMERINILKGLKKDSLITDHISSQLDSLLVGSGVTKYHLSIINSNKIVVGFKEVVLDSRLSLFNFHDSFNHVYSSDDMKYTIRWDADYRVPSSLSLVLELFVAGVGLIIVIILLLLRMERELMREKRESMLQQRYFFGLVHDLKMPISHAHSTIDSIQGELIKETPVNSLIDQMDVANDQIHKLGDKVQSLLVLRKDKQDKKPCLTKAVYLEDVVEDIKSELYAHFEDCPLLK